MPNVDLSIIAVGQDAELQRAAGGQALLDRFNFRLVRLGKNDLDLVLAELSHHHWHRPGGIDSSSDRLA